MYCSLITLLEDEDGHLKMGRQLVALSPEIDTSSYKKVYTHLPFSHLLINKLGEYSF